MQHTHNAHTITQPSQPRESRWSCFSTTQGPLFVKYNGVLRGIDGKVPFLVGQMVKYCCSEEVSEQFENGELTLEQVLPLVLAQE